MIIINKVILIGRTVKDIEVNNNVARFSLAVKRDFKNKEGKYESDFINCVAFDKRAETLSKFVKKGQEVALEGNWRTGSYEKDGVKVYTNEMFISNFSFIGGQAAGNNSASVQDNNTGFDGMTPVDDGDMPF